MKKLFIKKITLQNVETQSIDLDYEVLLAEAKELFPDYELHPATLKETISDGFLYVVGEVFKVPDYSDIPLSGVIK
ncbi:MAG: hypothetical protein COA31_002380 [Flavobacteriales bacterium]|nr:hypothetical protein [Flavobacteriales bacterium]